MSVKQEELIMEMKFENGEFERNVKTSMATLGQLKDALNMEGVSKGLEDIEKATRGIDLRGIGEGIDALNSKFSAIGTAARKTIENMATDAYNFVKNKVLAIPKFITSGIIEGGISRAMKIENAKFQLEGLKVAWDEISDDINYGVSDTAYGLDAAASAASQLVASGVKFGEVYGETGNSPMAKALRGISGVAAMTNREYDEISRIFTTVAGNGRMMGDQLNQLGERGMNAAATLADFFNDCIRETGSFDRASKETLSSVAHALAEFGQTAEVTEADIREMTSKGLISFDIFSEAMDAAFGEHAKDANRTFNGAMSNIKAALSRIGADYVTPLIETDSKVVQLLNSIRTKFNEFRKQETSKVAPAVSKIILWVANDVRKFVDAISFKNIVIDTEDLFKKFRAVRDIILGVLNIIKGILSPINLLIQAFREVFAAVIPSGEAMLKAAKAFRNLTEHFKLSYVRSQQLKEVFKGIFSIIDMIVRIVGTLLAVGLKIIGTILKPLFTILGLVGGKILDILAIVGKALVIADEWVRKNITVERVMNALKLAFGAMLYAGLKVLTFFKNLGKTISSKVTPVLSTVAQAFKMVGQWITETFELPKGFLDFIDKIKTAFSPVIEVISEAVTMVRMFFRLLTDEAFRTEAGFENIREVLIHGWSTLVETFSKLGNALKETFENIFGLKFGEVINSFLVTFKNVFKSIAEVFGSIGNLIKVFFTKGDTTAAVERLKKSFDVFGTSLKNVWNTIKLITDKPIKAIKEFLGTTFKLPDFSKYNSFKDLALGVFDSVSESIHNVIDSFRQFAQEKIGLPEFSGLARIQEFLSSGFETTKQILRDIVGSISGFIDDIVGRMSFTKFEKIREKIGEIFASIRDTITGLFRKDVSRSGLISLEDLAGGSGQLSKLEQFKENFIRIVGSIASFLKEAFKGVKITDIIDAVIEFGLAKNVIDAYNNINGILKNISKFVKKLTDGKGSITGLIESVTKMFDNFGGIGKGIKETLDTAKDSLNNFSKSVKYEALKKAATAVLILAGALAVIALIPEEKLGKSLGALSALVGEVAAMMVAVNLTSRAGKVSVTKKGGFQSDTFKSMATTIIAMAAAVAIIAKAVKTISDIDDPEKIKQGLIAITAIVGLISGVMIAFNKLEVSGRGGLANAVAMVGLSVSINLMVTALKSISKIDPEGLTRGLDALLKVILMMVAVIMSASLIDGKSALQAASSMVIMSAAMLIMAGAIAIIGKIDSKVASDGIIRIAEAIGIMMLALLLVDNSNAVKAAAAMVITATAMVIMSGAVALMGSIKPEKFKQGIIGCCAAIATMAASLAIVEGSNAVKAGAAMLIMATAMIVLSGAVALMGRLKHKTFQQGMIGIAVSIGIMTAALKILDGSNPLKAAASMVVFAAAMILMAGAVALMGAIGSEGVITGLIGIAGAVAIFTIAVNALYGMEATMLAFTGSLALLGVAIALVGAGMLAFALALDLIAVSGMAAAYVLADMAKLLFEKFLNLIVDCADALFEAVAELVQILVNAIIENVDIIVDGILTLIEHILAAIVERGPYIVDLLMSVVIGLLQSFSERLPELLDVLFDIIGTFFTMLFDRLRNTDVSYLINAAEMFGIISGLIVILNVIGPMVPGAMVALLGLSAFVAELALLLAALGALNSIPGLQDFVEKGGELLTAVGSIIGEFIGNLVGGAIGGIAEGISDSFPAIGSNLSAFWNNASDFIEGASGLEANSFAGIESLVKTMLLLTANDFLDAIASFFGIGGTSLADFAEELKEFAEPYVEFANAIGEANVDSAAVESSANALAIMAHAAQAIPNSGGKLADLIGDNTLAQFAEELKAFAPAIVYYSAMVDGRINETAVQASANALKIMTDAASSIQNQGGLAADIFGDNTLSQFAEELKAFAPAIVYYSAMVDGRINETAVQASANAIKIMTDAASTIENSGGLLSEVFGDNTLSGLAEDLKAFGPAIVGYSQTVTGNISQAGIEASATAVTALIEMAHGIQNSGGFISLFTGDNDLATFGTSLQSFGQSLVNYSTSIKDINTTQMASATNQVQKLIDLANGIATVDMSQVSMFADNMRTYAINGLNGFIEALSGADAESSINTSVTVLVGYVTSEMISHITELLDQGKESGNTVVTGIDEGMTEKQEDVKKTISDICLAIINKTKDTLLKSIFETYGKNNVVGGLISGMDDKKDDATNSISAVCLTIANTVSSNLSKSKFSSYGGDVVDGLCNGMNDIVKRASLRTSANGLSTIICSVFESNGVRYLRNKMFEIGADAVQGLINGLNSKLVQLRNTASQLGHEVQTKTKKALQESSPSKAMFDIGAYATLGLINGFVSLNKQLGYASEDTVGYMTNPIQEAISQVADLIDYGIDAEPTIRPVLDLTDIQNGVQTINGMFSEGINMSASYSKALKAGTYTDDIYSGGKTEQVSNNYNFTQNNYSPKALSRSEIYRQTKNQFAAVKGAVGRA